MAGVLRSTGEVWSATAIGTERRADVRIVETVVLLVALATVVAAFARRLRVPAPSLLVVVGLAVGMLPRAPAIDVPPGSAWPRRGSPA